MVENLNYIEQKKRSMDSLDDNMLDAPIVDLINAINSISCCFTLQSCYGHFLYNGQNDPYNLDPLPDTEIASGVEYRIAYIAFCIENNMKGRELLETLKKVCAISPDTIQFCSADWFWERQVNSYAIQVEPERYKKEDTAILSYREALNIEKTRNELFKALRIIFL
jgi:hypothetical protein